jgi:hypothetical protein
MIEDLFNYAIEPIPQPRVESFERRYLVDRADQCFRITPEVKIWEWAAEHVWIGEKMAAQPKLWDPKFTPWTKEWQELPMNDRGIRLGVAMKDSRSGFTEASLNALRFMPKHWPGGALYAINSRAKAREIMGKRILESMRETSGGFFTGDLEDEGLSKLTLTNMEIVVSGSGSSGPFMEAWYRLIILDELENHIQDQETTTLKRALSRQQDVPDGFTYAMAKPEKAGGIIDLAYISGSQKKYLVPCPRCERLIELSRKNLVYGHCEEKDGYNLARVLKETHWQCLQCGKAFHDHEKPSMVNADAAIWTPTPPEQRRRPPNGRFIPADPTVESYHMSSYYSLHERSTGGDLAREILQAEVINPTASGKKYVMTNFDGWPIEAETYSITTDSIDALKAGRVEEKEVTVADGTKTQVRHIVAPECLLQPGPDGTPRDGSYQLAYIKGKFQVALPFKPALLLIFTDKQKACLKYLVFAVLYDGTSFLVDVGEVRDEDEWHHLFERPYHIVGEAEPMFITHGYMDSRYKPLDVYRACLRAWQIHHVQVWPVKGEGDNEEFKGRTFRLVDDWADSQKLKVRWFYDHSLKDEFYINYVQNRMEPRIWLPSDLPQIIKNEWTAEHFNNEEKRWEHDVQKDGPNDLGDCGKFLRLWMHEWKDELRKLEPRPAPAEPS